MSINKQIPVPPGDNNGNDHPAWRAGHPIAPVLSGVKDNNTKSTPELMSINKQVPVPPGDDNGNEEPAWRAGHPIVPV